MCMCACVCVCTQEADDGATGSGNAERAAERHAAVGLDQQSRGLAAGSAGGLFCAGI